MEICGEIVHGLISGTIPAASLLSCGVPEERIAVVADAKTKTKRAHNNIRSGCDQTEAGRSGQGHDGLHGGIVGIPSQLRRACGAWPLSALRGR